MSNLLPPNSTRLEKALATKADRINQIPVTFAAMHDTATCPAVYLPWLAWEKRVEFWDDSWSDLEQRQAIAASKTFNQTRGTADALTSAIGQFTPIYQLQAWHALLPKGMPFSFTVQLPEDRTYSIDDIQILHAAIDIAKSARDVYSLQARIQTDSTVLVAGATRDGQHAHLSTLD